MTGSSSSADAGEEAGSSGSDSGLDSGADAGSSGGSDSGSQSGADSGHKDGSSDAGASGFDSGSDTGAGDSGTDSGDQEGGVPVTTATFYMDQTCPGITNTATLVISLEGTGVAVQRTPTPGGDDQDSCTYAGTLNGACNEITGTFSCTSGSGSWDATFAGQITGGSCTLATTWSEFEAFPDTSGCGATWTQQGGPPLSN